MPDHTDRPTRRTFAAQVAALSLAAVLPETGDAQPLAAAGDYDLSWTTRLQGASDKAVVDAPNATDFSLQLATRYLDNCDAAYGVGAHSARLVLTFRTAATALGLNDAMWEKYAIGTANKINDRITKQPATRNPYFLLPPGETPSLGATSLLLERKATVLVCDFALGHLATRLAESAGRPKDEVHRELRANLLVGAFAVPSGIWGTAKAQNLGCALIASPS